MLGLFLCAGARKSGAADLWALHEMDAKYFEYQAPCNADRK